MYVHTSLQNLGPIWKLLCCASMEVDVPSSAALKILAEQEEWEKGRKRRSEASFLHKRYVCHKCCFNRIFRLYYVQRNLQKKAKSSRHEKEKAYMEQLRSAGATVSEYVGNGQGEAESADTEGKSDEDAEPGVDDHHEDEVDSDSSSDDAHPLLFFYDCETTGFSIYSEHITEIAAKVVGVPLSSFSQPTFSSLVKTSRNISKKGNTLYVLANIRNPSHLCTVSDKTGITTALLRPEKPLSVVLPQFWKWIHITTQEHNEGTGSDHYPGLLETSSALGQLVEGLHVSVQFLLLTTAIASTFLYCWLKSNGVQRSYHSPNCHPTRFTFVIHWDT